MTARSGTRILLACLCLAAAAAAGPVSAGSVEADRPLQLAEGLSEGTGVLNTKSYHGIDTGRPVSVVALDDTDLNLKFRAQIIDQLRTAGYSVVDQADLELSFDNEVMQGAIESSGPSLGRLEAGTNTGVGRRSTDTGVDVNVNVWSSSQDSVLGGRKSGGSTRTASQLRVFAVLQDRRSGIRLWEGDARAVMSQSNPDRLGRAMVPPLVEALGQTVRREPFELR